MALRVDALSSGLQTAPVTPVYSAWTQALVDPKGEMSLQDIIKLLNISRNKMSLLWLLKRSDWTQLLTLLPKELLVFGLHFFDREKMLGLMMRMPPEVIMQMIYTLFTPDKLVKKMPLNDIMRILRAPQIDNRALIQHMQGMEPRFLKQLLGRIYGMNASQADKMKPADMWNLFFHTPKRRLMDGFKTLPYEALQPFAAGFLQEQPQLLGFVSGAFVDQLFDGVGKGQLMDACTVLPDELLILMLCQLQDKFLVQVAGQIDDSVFMQYLMADQSNLLRTLAAA
jgi:hypothetical protein